jgi:hypothetical protein
MSTTTKSKKSKASKAEKAPKQPKAAKPAKPTKEAKPLKPKKLSGLDAAAKVLHDAGIPMNMKTVMAEVLAKGLWKTSGSTPEATLYAAVIREIRAKGKGARFKKTDRGMFEFNKAS